MLQLKHQVEIVSLNNIHSGFSTKNPHVYDLLYEISKLCTYAHGDQCSGQALNWTAYLKEQNRDNQLISLLHHIFNVYFVLGGAVHYHRNDLKNFFGKIR